MDSEFEPTTGVCSSEPTPTASTISTLDTRTTSWKPCATWRCIRQQIHPFIQETHAIQDLPGPSTTVQQWPALQPYDSSTAAICITAAIHITTVVCITAAIRITAAVRITVVPHSHGPHHSRMMIASRPHNVRIVDPHHISHIAGQPPASHTATPHICTTANKDTAEPDTEPDEDRPR